MTRKMVDADFFALRPSGWNYEFKRRYVWLVTSFSELYAFVVFFVVFFCAKIECLQRVVSTDVDARVQTRVSVSRVS